jgi:hypothetical protein
MLLYSEGLRRSGEERYACGGAAVAAATAASDLLYRLRNRSTRPPVSMIRWRPV